ncbi:MAG: hypothetical protein SGPRY_005407 [Prymnesium sp.]
MWARLSSLLPRLEHAAGIGAAGATAGAAGLLACSLPSHLHISAIPLSIVLGATAGNLAPSHLMSMLKPGLSYSSSTLLRSGIVCVGAKLSAAQILALGWTTVPAAACSVGAGLVVIPRLASAFGLAPRLGALLASGTSICGVTAISAVAPAIGATQAEVAIAVANVVAFGSFGMFVYPHVSIGIARTGSKRELVAAALFAKSDSGSIGLFFGLAVHDTAQVMGCAASYAEQHTDSAVVGAAAIAKLTRNVFLAAVVPFMAVKHAAGASSTFSAKTLAAAVPVFVGGFLAMAAVRTIGDAQLANGGTALYLFNKDDFKRGADWIGAFLGTKGPA